MDGRVAELPEATVEGHGVLRPERLEQRDALLEARNALVERDAERLELLRHVAGAEADHEAPAADDVEGRELLGQDDGVVERRQHHRGRELDLRIELPGEPGEERDGLQPARARKRKCWPIITYVRPVRWAASTCRSTELRCSPPGTRVGRSLRMIPDSMRATR